MGQRTVTGRRGRPVSPRLDPSRRRSSGSTSCAPSISIDPPPCYLDDASSTPPFPPVASGRRRRWQRPR
eukprot:5835891-Pyramimonas_sp.AAC.1